MRVRGLALVAVLALAISLAGEGGAASQSRLAWFRPASGWLIQRAGPDNPSLVVAVTARDASAVHPVALFASFKKLSHNGILVWADTLGRGRSGFPVMTAWPPKLSRFRVDHGWEGQPAANIEQRVWVGSVRGWDLDIRVFFATQHPHVALLTKAQSELSRLGLP